MDDDILARAKLLSQAATQVASELSNQANEYKAVVDARHKDEAQLAAVARNERTRADKQRVPRGKDIGEKKEFRGAVINGSSLITTYADMRPFVPRGSAIVIDGINCRLQSNNNAEWSANRMELLEDFNGPTNLDAVIQTTVTADVVRRRSPKKNKAAPVKTNDIMSAVSDLNTSSMLSGRDPLPNPKDYIKQNGTINTSRSSAGKKKKKLNEGGGAINTGRSEYETLHTFKNRTSSSLHPLNPNVKRVKADFLSSQGKTQRESPRSLFGGSTTSTVVSTVPPRSECTHLEEEQYQMMLEMDSLTEEEKDQARAEMNLRMVDRGLRKANERVEEYKHRLKLPETLMEDQPYNPSTATSVGSVFGSPGMCGSSYNPEDQRGKNLTPDQLIESRREARERYLQKQKEEDAAIEANLKAERKMKEAIKKKMEEKAKKLQELTAIRVAKYKATKREQAKKEKEAKELALALKKEKEQEAASEEYIRKMQARMQETEKRLNRQKKEQEEKAHREKLQQEVILRELAAERHRTENTLDYVRAMSQNIPSPQKRSGSAKDKFKSKDNKLPRIDLNGKNNKRVNKLSTRKGNSGERQDTENNDDDSENDNIVVTIGLHDNYHRKGNLNTTRNSKSEQSNRMKESKRRRRLQKQSSVQQDEEYYSQHHATIKHVVHIGKPPKIEHTDGPKTSARGESGDNNHGNSLTNSAERSRYDAFDNNNEDDFFDNDDDNLSDDSLTLSAPPVNPNANENVKPSLIPVYKGKSQSHAMRDFDISSCVSALTVEDEFSKAEDRASQSGGQIMKKKKKKKKLETWKMKPIEVQAYVPVPQQTPSVDNR